MSISKFLTNFMHIIYLRNQKVLQQDFFSTVNKIEPPHDKTNKVTARPAKTQESLLCAQWVAKDPSFLHADSADSDQTGRMPRLIWVFAERTSILLVLSRDGSIVITVH